MCTFGKNPERNCYYLRLKQYWSKLLYVHTSRTIEVLFDKKIGAVVIDKNPLTDACCSLCKLDPLDGAHLFVVRGLTHQAIPTRLH